MKFKVAKQDLEAALKTVGATLSSDEEKLTGHYLFRLNDGKVEILGAQARIFGGVPLHCTIEDDGGAQAFTIAAWRLTRWVSAVGNVAVTIECESSTVQCKGPHGTIKLPSLDPKTFPYWDARLAEAEDVGTFDAMRLHKALSYVKPFVADREEKRPDISLTELRDGYFFATDTMAVTAVRLTDKDGNKILEGCKFKLHVKDIPIISKFLAYEGNVQVFEYRRPDEGTTSHVFFQREDGAMFGASCPEAEFPGLDWSDDVDLDIYFEVAAEDLRSAITQITSTMRKGEERVRFIWDGSDLTIQTSDTQTGDTVAVKVPSAGGEGVDNFPEQGFKVRYEYLLHLMKSFATEELRFGVLPRGANGMVRFVHKDGTDLYTTILMYRNN